MVFYLYLSCVCNVCAHVSLFLSAFGLCPFPPSLQVFGWLQCVFSAFANAFIFTPSIHISLKLLKLI